MTTKAEKAHLARVAQLPCVLCGDSPVEVHHVRTGAGLSQRSSHYLTVPLCPACHRGQFGLHGDKAVLRVRKVTEMDLLARVIERLTA